MGAGVMLLDKLFRREEINGAERCPTYLYRWTLLAVRGMAVYLHRFVGDDWARDMHDHPKRFISIGLRGQYIEETPDGERLYRAPWVRTFPATHIHRLRMVDGGECWTLVIVMRTVRPWGFWLEDAHGRSWVPWKKYVYTDIGKKACP